MAQGNGNGNGPSFDKQYWESRIDLDKIRRRAEIHARLKQEFLRCTHNPYNMSNFTPLEDPATSRLTALHEVREETLQKFYNHTWRNFFKFTTTGLLPVALHYCWVTMDMDRKDFGCENGFMPYSDRLFKHY